MMVGGTGGGILLLSYNYAPEAVGIAVYNRQMAESLAARGWPVEVLTAHPWYPAWQMQVAPTQEDLAGVRVHRLPLRVPVRPTAVGRILMDVTWLARAAIRLGTWRRRPGVVQVVAPPVFGLVVGAVYAAWWRVPVACHVQDLQVDVASQLGFLPRWLVVLLHAVEAVLLRRMDQVTTITPAMAARLAPRCGQGRPVRLLPNGTDLAALVPPPGPNSLRRAWGIPDGDVVVLYAGSAGAKQGLHVLTEAMALLKDEGRLHLVMAVGGTALDRDGLLQRIADLPRARIIDLVPPADLGSLLAAGDIHVITQRAGAADLVLPSKLGNIMGAGRPVVVTADAASDLARIVVKSGGGLVTPPNDATVLAEALRRLAGAPSLRFDLGAAARVFAARHLDARRVQGRWHDLWRSLIRRGRGGRDQGCAEATSKDRRGCPG